MLLYPVGVFGLGLDTHILDAYTFFANNYEVDDELFIFNAVILTVDYAITPRSSLGAAQLRDRRREGQSLSLFTKVLGTI